MLLGYYQHEENLAMQAFVLNGIGDIYHRQDDLEKAKHYYECAVVPVKDANEPIVFHTIMRNLGDVSFKQKNYSLAEVFYENANQLASAMLDPEAKVHDLEWRGFSQEQQHKAQEAIESWETARLLCKNTDLPEQQMVILKNLQRIYTQLGLHQQLAEVRQELQQINSP